MILRRLLPLLTFHQLPPLPNTGGRGDLTSDRPDGPRGGPVVGGYFANRPGDVVRQTSGSLAGGGTYVGQDFDPYRAGDQHRILRSLVNQGTVYDLQLALVQAGLLDEGDIAFGYLDDSTSDAFATVLGIANQNGMNWRDVLSQIQAAGGVGGNTQYGGGSGSSDLAPTVIQLPNRDDLVAGARDFTFQNYGVMLDDDLLQGSADAVLDSLRTQQERQVQSELQAPRDGSVVFTESAPDVGRLLEEEVRQRAPDVVFDKNARDLADLWFSDIVQGPV